MPRHHGDEVRRRIWPVPALSDYVILGACSPPLAHRALQAEPAIGLLLPCNVVVTTDDEGNAVVSAIDPTKVFELVERDDVRAIAQEVKGRLERVIAAIGGV